MKRESIDAPCNLYSPSPTPPYGDKWQCTTRCEVFSYEIIKFSYNCDGHLMHLGEIEVKGMGSRNITRGVQ